MQHRRKIIVATCLTALLLGGATIGVSAADNEEERFDLFYADMIEGIEAGQTDINVESVGIHTGEIAKFYDAFKADNPYYSFFLKTNTEYTSIPATGIVSAIHVVYDDINTIESRQETVREAVEQIVSQINSEWSDAYKALWINNYICDEYSYSNDGDDAGDLYGFIVNKKGNCEAYTNLYIMLARGAGLEASFCHSQDLAHAWNMVMVDGEWYHVDSTWNDNYDCRYSYFLLSDSENADVRDSAEEFDTFSRYSATSSRFHEAFWREGMVSNIAATHYGFYGIEGEDIYLFDMEDGSVQSMATIGEYLWSVPNSTTQFYRDTYHDVVGKKNYLFYSTPDVVYEMNLATGAKKAIYELENNSTSIFGLKEAGKDLQVVCYNPEDNTEEITTLEGILDIETSYCNVSFKVDGTVVHTERVEIGTPIPYPNIVPEKESNEYYSYEFVEWTGFADGMMATSSELSFEAVFEPVIKTYSVKLIGQNGAVLGEIEVDAGTKFGDIDMPDGENFADDLKYLVFEKWDGPEESFGITEDISVQALYSQIDRFTIGSEDDTILIEIFDLIEQAIISNTSEIDIYEKGLSALDLDKLYTLYSALYPETSYMLSGVVANELVSGTELVVKLGLNLDNAEDAEQKFEWVDSKLNSIVSAIDVDWSELQKVLWVNDYICDNFRQLKDAEDLGLYEFLSTSSGSSSGYTDLFAALMKKLGISVSTARTELKRETLVWNKVKIGEEWYNIDVAKNDSFEGHYNYFLLSDEILSNILGTAKLPAKIVSNYTSTDVKYDSAFWRDGLYCSIVPVDSDGYTIIGDKIYKVDLEELSVSPVKVLSSYIWVDEATEKKQDKLFFDMIAIGDLLLYSTPSKVFAYSLSTQDHRMVYESTKTIPIFSLQLEGNLLVLGHCSDMAGDLSQKNTVQVENIVQVTYLLEDGSVYATQTYVAGSELEYPANPAKENYQFVGWSLPEKTTVESNLTLTVSFKPVKNMCTVIFMADGVRYYSIVVEEGTKIILPSENPTKASDTYYDYEFVLWEGFEGEVRAQGPNMFFNAQFKETARKYKVEFFDGDKLIDSALYEAGTLFATVAKPHMDDKVVEGITYVFTGWDQTPDEVLWDISLQAIYQAQPKMFTVRYYNDTEIVFETIVEQGTKLSLILGTGVTRPSTETHKYYFDKWEGASEGEIVRSDLNLYATFREVEIVPETEESETETDIIVPPKAPVDYSAIIIVAVVVVVIGSAVATVAVISRAKRKE